MIYLVQTQYCAGVFLSKAAILQRLGNARVTIFEFSSYDEAQKAFKAISDRANVSGVPEEAKPNYLYQVFDRRVYTVIYSKRRVGFVKVDYLKDFANRYNMKLPCRSFPNMEFEKARIKTAQMGAITRKLQYGGHESPKPGIYYWRDVP